MSGPFFSVIVPTYNRARMLRTALATVRGQSFAEWECFVVDDGSTDDTAAVLEEFASDPRFRALRSESNQGMNASRNRALAEIRGDFATFLDSDDLWLPDRLQKFFERARRSPEAGFLFSNAYVWRYGRVIGTLFDPSRPIPEGAVPGCYAIGGNRLPYVTSNVAIRREAFERWGKFRTEMRTLDTELFARFLAAGLKVAAIGQPLSVRRLHGDQLTDRYRENFEESMKALAASGADAAESRRLRAEVAAEVALYLIKAGKPSEARAFLRDALGDGARASREWRLSYTPGPALVALKALRSLYLRLRYHPALAPAEYRAVDRAIAPLLAAEVR